MPTINVLNKSIKIIKFFPVKCSSFLKAQISLYIAWASFCNVCLFSQVLEDRVPFLMGSIKDLQHYVPSSKDSIVSGLI